MSFINMPEIVACKIDQWVLIGFAGPFPVFALKAVGYNMTPLPKTWYEEEVDTDATRTIRLAKRSDHTGILIKIDKHEFYRLPGPPG